MSLDFKKKLEIEDETFKSSNEVYFKLIDILETATNYDEDKHDILCTIDEIKKYLEPFEFLIENLKDKKEV